MRDSSGVGIGVDPGRGVEGRDCEAIDLQNDREQQIECKINNYTSYVSHRDLVVQVGPESEHLPIKKLALNLPVEILSLFRTHVATFTCERFVCIDNLPEIDKDHS